MKTEYWRSVWCEAKKENSQDNDQDEVTTGQERRNEEKHGKNSAENALRGQKQIGSIGAR